MAAHCVSTDRPLESVSHEEGGGEMTVGPLHAAVEPLGGTVAREHVAVVPISGTSDEVGVRLLVRMVLEVWLTTEGFWSRQGVYLQVKESLMQGDEEAGVQAAIAGEVSCMMEASTGNSVTHTSESSLHTFRCRSQEGETAVCLRRTAVVSGCGAVLYDGFTLCARRFRCSMRSIRPDTHMISARF